MQPVPWNGKDVGIANAKVPTLAQRTGQIDLQSHEVGVDRLQAPSDPQSFTGLGVIYQVARVVLQSDGFGYPVC
jgi:hypothetical protein